MKIVSNILEDVDGIHIYYIIGLLIFVAFFVGMLIKTFRMPKEEADYIRNSILEEDADDFKTFETKN